MGFVENFKQQPITSVSIASRNLIPDRKESLSFTDRICIQFFVVMVVENQLDVDRLSHGEDLVNPPEKFWVDRVGGFG